MRTNGPSVLRRHIHTALTGAMMGLAELVPGFSAGTVAYVAGIYTRFLALLHAALRLPVAILTGEARRGVTAIDWPFALTLASSMLATVFLAAGTVRTLIDTAPVVMSALFFGLVLGAVVAAVRNLAHVKASDVIMMTCGAAGVFVLLGAGSANSAAIPPVWLVFSAGMIAISAWILPGISGSFMLVILGIYPIIVGAVADRDVATLAVFAAGCVAGIAVIVNALTRLLARHGHRVRVVLIAIMLGSGRVLWPFSASFASTDLGVPDSLMSFALIAVVIASAAAAVIWVAARTPKE